jgi:hypothetical protein
MGIGKIDRTVRKEIETYFEYSFFKEDPTKVEHGYRTMSMHVGAICDKLSDLRETLESKFGKTLAFHEEILDYGNKNNSYQGNLNGVSYSVSIEYIACPIPFTMAQAHYINITLPEGVKDEITPIIKEKFLEYEKGVKGRLE